MDLIKEMATFYKLVLKFKNEMFEIVSWSLFFDNKKEKKKKKAPIKRDQSSAKEFAIA